jgi:hypothetical protein
MRLHRAGALAFGALVSGCAATPWDFPVPTMIGDKQGVSMTGFMKTDSEAGVLPQHLLHRFGVALRRHLDELAQQHLDPRHVTTPFRRVDRDAFVEQLAHERVEVLGAFGAPLRIARLTFLELAMLRRLAVADVIVGLPRRAWRGRRRRGADGLGNGTRTMACRRQMIMRRHG